MTTSCVYIVECQGFYKIGKTTNLKQRLSDIQMANPFHLDVVHTIFTGDYDKVEAGLHKIYSQQNVSGEWFSLGPQDLYELKAMTVSEILDRARRIVITSRKSTRNREWPTDLELQADLPLPVVGPIIVPLALIEKAYESRPVHAALFGSFLRILSLGWSFKYKKTPILNEDSLMKYLRLSRRQYIQNIGDMARFGWLTKNRPTYGHIEFSFPYAVDYDEES